MFFSELANALAVWNSDISYVSSWRFDELARSAITRCWNCNWNKWMTTKC